MQCAEESKQKQTSSRGCPVKQKQLVRDGGSLPGLEGYPRDGRGWQGRAAGEMVKEAAGRLLVAGSALLCGDTVYLS